MRLLGDQGVEARRRPRRRRRPAVGGQCSWTRSSVSTPRLARERSVQAGSCPACTPPASARTRRPILVATVSPASGRLRRKRPISCSLRPSPYTSAVSRKVTPASTAAASMAMRVVLADAAPVGAELPGAEADHADGPAQPVEAALFHAASLVIGLPGLPRGPYGSNKTYVRFGRLPCGIPTAYLRFGDERVPAVPRPARPGRRRAAPGRGRPRLRARQPHRHPRRRAGPARG